MINTKYIGIEIEEIFRFGHVDRHDLKNGIIYILNIWTFRVYDFVCCDGYILFTLQFI